VHGALPLSDHQYLLVFYSLIYSDIVPLRPTKGVISASSSARHRCPRPPFILPRLLTIQCYQRVMPSILQRSLWICGTVLAGALAGALLVIVGSDLIVAAEKRRQQQLQKDKFSQLQNLWRLYDYESLGDPDLRTIRLIELLPGESTDSLNIKILQSSLTERPYEAVSYC
jgi:hypothetical protein